MTAEVELKLLADEPSALTTLAAVAHLGPASLGSPRSFDEVDRYVDTDDGRLAAHGWACRLRDRSGAVTLSMKGPPEPTTSEWLHRRPEVEGPATAELDPAAWPRSQARALLESLAGGAPLSERLRLHQRRTERGVVTDRRTVGTLSLDEVRVEADGRVAGSFAVVELELADDLPVSADLVQELGAALRAVPGLSPDPQTKLERALTLIDAGSRRGP